MVDSRNLGESFGFQVICGCLRFEAMDRVLKFQHFSHPKMGAPLTKNEDLLIYLRVSFSKNGHQGMVIEIFFI